MADALNMKLLAHEPCGSSGNMGEGMSLQVAKDGRRIMWMAHESAPANFSGVDVSDPRKPKMIIQTELPHRQVRSNSLEVCGDIMAVAYQTAKPGLQPAGFELFDISTPEKPKSIALFDCSGPHSRGVHQVWFVDGEYVHFASGAPDFEPTNPTDDQIYRIVDVRNPSKPTAVGRWWLRAPAKATTCRRRRAIPSSIQAFACTTPTSIPSARTAPISAISTAACSSSISRTRAIPR